MNRTNEKLNYKIAFFAAVAVIVALSALLLRHTKKLDVPQAFASAKAAVGAPVETANRPPAEPALVPVQLTPERMQSIGVKLAKASYENVTDEIRASGNVDINERQIAYVQTRFPGWIRDVYANASYQFVRKGQPLFTIYSPDLVTTEQEYLLAQKNAEALQSSTVAGVASGSESLLAAARQRLEQWEVPGSEIAKLQSSGKIITNLTFKSPVTGYITERNALPNMYVQPDSKLYTVADLSTVWVNANVFQTDLGKIKPGDPVAVTVDAYPGRTFSGRVSEILPQVDANTRTARVRIVMPNPNLKLMPGMFVNVNLKAPLGRQLVVPSSAVLNAGLRQLVFVSQGEGSFVPRDVQAEQHGDQSVVTKGLKAGETVVSSANFLIDSESQLQAAVGSFAPPAQNAGAASAVNQGQTQAVIGFSTQPDPPHKGDNVFRVKLADKNGVPLNGAQVSVIFFMPAMPAMGMAAMKTEVQLSDKGGGIYEGAGSLGSGGTWQVTITASQNGQVVASKHFSATAEGGM